MNRTTDKQIEDGALRNHTFLLKIYRFARLVTSSLENGIFGIHGVTVCFIRSLVSSSTSIISLIVWSLSFSLSFPLIRRSLNWGASTLYITHSILLSTFSPVLFLKYKFRVELLTFGIEVYVAYFHSFSLCIRTNQLTYTAQIMFLLSNSLF